MPNAASASHLNASADAGVLQKTPELITTSDNENCLPIEQGHEQTPESPPSEIKSDLPGESADASLAAADAIKGVLLGLTAATGYSIANLALRKLATGEGGFYWDVWISGTKAVPTFIVAGVMLLIGMARRQVTLPSWKVLAPLFITAVVMQFGGNLGFQLALRQIGLAITVPIVFSSIIVSGAIVGRMVVGDAVSLRTAFSMGLMVVSIAFLSAAAHSGSQPTASDGLLNAASGVSHPPTAEQLATATAAVSPERQAENSSRRVTFGIVIALISGLSYGLCGVVIRRVVRNKLPIEITLVVFSVTGLLTLCPISLYQLGLSSITATSVSDWWAILAAGTFNAVGFFAITHALRFLTISRANVVNASLIAMCAVGDFVFFAEPISTSAMIGIGLTIIGLLTLDRK